MVDQTEANLMMESIYDAVHEVQKYNTSVEKIVLERDKYYKLATSKDFLISYYNNPLLMQRRNAVKGEKTIGVLWGMPLELGEKSRIYSKHNPRHSAAYSWFPSLTYGLPPGTDEGFSVEIQFDGIKYKIRRLKNNLTIIVKSRAEFFGTIPKNEWTAIDTLREIITEKEFRNYLRYGFILVKGKSGKVYQIFRNKHHIKVWLNGKVIEEVCVRIKNGKIPPTDNVIAFKIMVEADEAYFHQIGNVYKMRQAT